MLNSGGRAAVIIPDGVLFGSSKAHKQIRQQIVEHNRLEAVISMPSGVFKPYAGVSTAILIFTKTNNGGTDNVWFYDMQADGYSLDDKRTPLLGAANGELHFRHSSEGWNPEDHAKNNIPDILKRFKNRQAETGRQRTEQSFMVPFEEIKANDWDLSINRYKEVVSEAVEYDPPEQIIAQIEQLDKERQQALAVLKEMLG
jgi:type I restriction enzyme M protein